MAIIPDLIRFCDLLKNNLQILLSQLKITVIALPFPLFFKNYLKWCAQVFLRVVDKAKVEVEQLTYI